MSFKYEVGQYLLRTGNHRDYLYVGSPDKVPQIWKVSSRISYAMDYGRSYKISAGYGCLEISESWIDKDFKKITKDEAIIHDILE